MRRIMDVGDKEALLKEVMVANRAIYEPPPISHFYDNEHGNSTSPGRSRRFRMELLDINEVYPSVFISDETTARNKHYLRSIGITHVVNAAEGQLIGFVNTCSSYYSGTGIIYKGIHLADLSMSDASKYFKEASQFINKALNDGGRVLVHCVMGISRSGTLVLAFLMMKREMTAIDAMTTVRQKRNIHPNDGFLRQLAKLDNKLIRKRYVSPEPHHFRR